MAVVLVALACRLMAPPDSCAELPLNTMRWMRGAPSAMEMAPPFVEKQLVTVRPVEILDNGLKWTV